MKVEIITTNVKRITPEEGLFATQATLEDESQRTFFGKQFNIGKNGNPDAWTEWTAEEKSAWEAKYLAGPEDELV